MTQVLVTSRQALRKVAELMLAKQADRTRQSDLHAQIHQGVFQPLRALKAVVHELAVTAERKSKQQDNRS